MLQPGQTILDGKYRILRLIGEGGMARVWLVEEPAAVRQVAIKEIKREGLSEAERRRMAAKRFAAEIQNGAKIFELAPGLESVTCWGHMRPPGSGPARQC